MNSKVTVEYCTAWNYEPRAASLAAKICQQAEIARVELVPSRGGAFEIRVNGELIYSKLKIGKWPDFDTVATQVRQKLNKA